MRTFLAYLFRVSSYAFCTSFFFTVTVSLMDECSWGITSLLAITLSIGFLVDERRFCVGITRFKYKLIVIGNEKTLSLSNSSEQSYYDIYEEKEKYIYYKQFIDFVKKKGRYIDGVSELNKLLAKTNVDLKIKKSKVDKKRNLDFAKKLVEKVYESNVANLKKEIVKLEKNSKNKKINEKLLKNYKSLDSKDLGKALELNGILKVLVEE